jgi:hypothetical protein
MCCHGPHNLHEHSIDIAVPEDESRSRELDDDDTHVNDFRKENNGEAIADSMVLSWMFITGSDPWRSTNTIRKECLRWMIAILM